MSDKRNDGGPAFPQPMDVYGGGEGMTLRDCFAAHAVTGIIATHKPGGPTDEGTNPAETTEMYHAFALTAYRIADAMLAERAK